MTNQERAERGMRMALRALDDLGVRLTTVVTRLSIDADHRLRGVYGGTPVEVSIRLYISSAYATVSVRIGDRDWDFIQIGGDWEFGKEVNKVLCLKASL